MERLLVVGLERAESSGILARTGLPGRSLGFLAGS